MATSGSRCCHRLGSTVEGSRVSLLPVPGSGPEGPTQNSLTFNTASTRAQTRFAKEIFGQKSVASKNCCCCCPLLLLCYCCCYWPSLCGASCCSLFASLDWAAAAVADLAAFCCWCCNHVKCQFAFCAIRATLHKQQQQHLRQQPMLQLQPCFQFVTGLKYFY